MIVMALLDVLYRLLDLLLILDIPSLPTEVANYVTQFFDYLAMGAGILSNYAPLGYLLILLGVILAVDSGILIYHFVMWVLKKVPMLGVQ